MSSRSYIPKETGQRDENPYLHIIGLFSQAIALHAVEGDRADYERFRADIDQFANRLTSQTIVSDLYLSVGGALRAMQEYNHRTTDFVRNQTSELQKMISMLTETVITIVAGHKASVSKLEEIEKAIAGASEVKDIQLLKARLADCLRVVREEAQRQKVDGQKAIECLQQELKGGARGAEYPGPPLNMDAVTDLPDKAQATAVVQAVLDSPQDKFLLVAVVNRVQAINARFGYVIGDRVLRAAASHFRKNLGLHDQLFRWHGPTLLAVLTRTEQIGQVRAEVRRFADTRLESTVEIGQRSVLLPISANWYVLPVVQPLDALLKQVDTFIAAQFSRDYV